MNRRTILTFSAIAALGLTLVPGSVIAQQGTLRAQLVGTWAIVSDLTPAVAQQVGSNPKGYVMMDSGGRYVQVLRNSDRPKSAGRAEGVIAQFGTWSVNEADKTLTLHREGALNASLEGTDQKISVSLTGDDLKLTATNLANGARIDIVYRRAK